MTKSYVIKDGDMYFSRNYDDWFKEEAIYHCLIRCREAAEEILQYQKKDFPNAEIKSVTITINKEG